MIDPERQNFHLPQGDKVGLFEIAFIGSAILNILCLGFIFKKRI